MLGKLERSARSPSCMELMLQVLPGRGPSRTPRAGAGLSHASAGYLWAGSGTMVSGGQRVEPGAGLGARLLRPARSTGAWQPQLHAPARQAGGGSPCAARCKLQPPGRQPLRATRQASAGEQAAVRRRAGDAGPAAAARPPPPLARPAAARPSQLLWRSADDLTMCCANLAATGHAREARDRDEGHGPHRLPRPGGRNTRLPSRGGVAARPAAAAGSPPKKSIILTFSAARPRLPFCR